MVQLFNTKGQAKQDFTPNSDNLVKMYTCGPTVYDKLHIGNWSAYIYWDLLVRMLLANDMKIDRVLNITDVGHLTSDQDTGEDKLEAGARREGTTAWEIARMYTEDFMKGMQWLGMIVPEHIAKATDYIPQQLDLVRVLKEKGYTYQTTDGIYYDTSKFPKYADFARLHLDKQEAGARVTENIEKKNPSDFALWKFSDPAVKREMEWPTPADVTEDGKERMGFPGWHLECSAIAMDILGPTLDIHTGGIDHIPVHHSNEIAQSEAATGQEFSNFWLHCNHLKVDGTKISKSLKNGYTLDTLREKGFTANDIRMFVLQSHYSNEGNFTFENLESAKKRVERWLDIASLRHQVHNSLHSEEDLLADDKTLSLYDYTNKVLEAVSDNLDAPKALMLVDDAFSKVASTPLENIHKQSLGGLLETIKDILGIDLMTSTPDISDDIKKLILERRNARSSADWKKSDELRDELLRQGVAIRDTGSTSVWTYAR